jgi:hypothetical protein
MKTSGSIRDDLTYLLRDHDLLDRRQQHALHS